MYPPTMFHFYHETSICFYITKDIFDQDGVQAQHTLGTFKHDSMSSSPNSVKFERVFIPRSVGLSIVEKIKTKLPSPENPKGAGFANIRMKPKTALLSDIDPARQKGATGVFTCVGLIEWAAEAANINNGQGFIPAALEKIGQKLLPALSPELLYFQLTQKLSDPAALKRAFRMMADPVDFIITDPQGRRLGHTAQLGTFNEIPGALYTGDGDFEQAFIANAQVGTYKITFYGLNSDASSAFGVGDNVKELNEFLTTSDIREFTLEVQNAAPVANDDSVSIVEFESIDISPLVNDVDPDGILSNASISITEKPVHGIATFDKSTGQVSYTPDLLFTGEDSFKYLVKDADGAASNVATVTITVTPAVRIPQS